MFVAITPESGDELWVTDGTAEGTRMGLEIEPGPAAGVVFTTGLTSIGGGKAVFAGWTEVNGAELWITDGTPEGTFMLDETNPGPAHGLPRDFALALTPVPKPVGEVPQDAGDEHGTCGSWSTDALWL